MGVYCVTCGAILTSEGLCLAGCEDIDHQTANAELKTEIRELRELLRDVVREKRLHGTPVDVMPKIYRALKLSE